jgi:hypothetical protein
VPQPEQPADPNDPVYLAALVRLARISAHHLCFFSPYPGKVQSSSRAQAEAPRAN